MDDEPEICEREMVQMTEGLGLQASALAGQVLPGPHEAQGAAPQLPPEAAAATNNSDSDFLAMLRFVMREQTSAIVFPCARVGRREGLGREDRCGRGESEHQKRGVNRRSQESPGHGRRYAEDHHGALEQARDAGVRSAAQEQWRLDPSWDMDF